MKDFDIMSTLNSSNTEADFANRYEQYLPIESFFVPQKTASFVDSFTATAKRESVLYNLGDDLIQDITKPNYDPNLAYNVFNDIKGYENYANNFVGVYSQEEANLIKAQIDADNERRDVSYDNFFGSLTGSIAAFATDTAALAVLSPTIASLNTIRTTKSIGGFVKAAALSGTYEATRELALQATDESRDKWETIYNIAGASILGGAFGSISGASLEKNINSDLGKLVGDYAQDKVVYDIVKTDAGFKEIAKDKLTGKTVENFTNEGVAFTNPVFEKIFKGSTKIAGTLDQRLLTYDSDTVKVYTNKLLEHPYVLKKNLGADGVASDVSAETLIEIQRNRVNPLLFSLKDDLTEYASRTRNGLIDFKNTPEFFESVGRVLIDGTTEGVDSAVVSAAGKVRKFLYDIGKDGEKRNLLNMRDNYFPMLPKRDAILDNVDGFISSIKKAVRLDLEKTIDENIASKSDELVTAAKELRLNKDAFEQEVNRIAEEFTYREVLGTRRTDGEFVDIDPNRLMKFNYTNRFGQSRPLNLDLRDIKDYIDTNVENVLHIYTNSMARDIGIYDALGGKGIQEIRNEIGQEYAEKLRNVTDPVQKAKLVEESKAALEDITVAYNELLGRNRGYDPSGIVAKVSLAGRVFNNLRMMGMSPIAMIGDTGAIVANKILNLFKPQIKMFQEEFGKLKLSKKDALMLDASIANSHRRLQNLGGTDNIFTEDATNKIFAKVQDSYFRMIGSSLITSVFRSAAMEISAEQLLAAGKLLIKGGKLADSELTRIRALGLDTVDLIDAYKSFQKHSVKVDGQTFTNFENWGPDSVKFQAALIKKVRQDIVEPSVGNRYNWTLSPIGKLFSQYTSFVMGAWSKFTLAGLQRMDSEFMLRAAASLPLGMSAYIAREVIAGKDPAQIHVDPNTLIYQAFNYGGLFSLLTYADSIAGQVLPSMGGANIAQLVGAQKSSSRLQNLDLVSTLNPTVGAAYSVLQLPKRFIDGEITPTDYRALVKLTPFNNIWYINGITNQVGLQEQIRRQDATNQTEFRG